MNIYYRNLYIRIAFLVLTSVGIGLSIASNILWLMILSAILTALAIYLLLNYQNRTVKDLKRFIDAVRFSEFNISFIKATHKGLHPEFAEEMEKSIDIFNEKMLQQEANLNFYETLLNRIDFAVVAVNPAKQIIWINKAALDIFGEPQPNKLSDLKRVSKELPSTLDKLIPKDAKVIKLTSDNKYYNLVATTVFTNIRGVDMKIFSLKNIQPVLDEAESEAWKKLIRILTHEMMNSITPIISLAETFSDQDMASYDPEMMSKAMQTIHRRSKGLVQFVNNYQRLTRIPVPELSTFTAKDIMEDIANLMKSQNIRFSCMIIPHNLKLNADRSQMEQVLINLIKNAWQAAYKKPDPEIKIMIEKDEFQRPVITITDNGVGILPDVVDKIFIPFFTTKKEGSGIGLSICRQIITAHGGTIEASSRPEEGTTFTIRL